MKDAYEKARKDHSVLPQYDELNHEFELFVIDHPDFILRQVKRRMAEKLDTFASLLESLISPDPGSLTQMYECRVFTDAERKLMVELYRHIMSSYRLLLETDLFADDKTDAETIRKVFDMWSADKKQLLPFVKKVRDSWQKHVEPREFLEYLG